MRFLVPVVLLGLLAGVPPSAAQSDPPPAPPAPAANVVDIGPIKNLKFSGVLNVWYQGGDQGFVDTFRLRRARLYFSGNMTPRARFQVMVDLSKALTINQERVTVDGASVVTGTSVNQASRILQDAYIAVKVAPRLELTAGQFKLPMNYEGNAPVQELPLAERSLVTTDRSRGGLFGDLREIGVMARGTVGSAFEYRVGVFNGLGTRQNEVDQDDRKSVAARVAYQTPLAGLLLGAFGAWDREAVTHREQRRTGLDAHYRRGRLRLDAELVEGRDGALTRRGCYGTAAWRLRPRIELVTRLDVFDPDTHFDRSRSDARERDYIGGVTYFISGNNLELQAEYLRKTFALDLSPRQHVAIVNLQLAW
jgi:hypothetical protein